MTYTSAVKIIGTGTVSAAEIDGWFAAKGPAYKGYAPDKTYQPAPADLGASIVAECARYASLGYRVNHDMAAAQILHETAAWQSGYARERNNPGGIGAINSNPDLALWFPSVAAGVRAHVAHLLVYAVGDGDWTANDPRRDNVANAGWLGSAPTWGGLNGKWAFPGTTYGQSIATLANQLTTFADDTGGPPMAGDDSRFAWMPDVSEFGYPKGTHGRNGRSIDLGIVHYTQGTNSSGWLRGNNGSSTHYLTKLDMTPFEQHVLESNAAWTAGNSEYNLRGINVEGELPGNQWTPALIREFAKTTYPIWKRNNIPLVYLGSNNGPGKRGLIGHADVPDQDHTDPGSTFDWPLYIAELNALDGATPPPSDWPKVPVTERDPWRESNPWSKDKWIPRVFVAGINAEGFMSSGYVLTEAFAEDDKVVQYFERARWELHRDGSITKGLVGLEALGCRHRGWKPT